MLCLICINSISMFSVQSTIEVRSASKIFFLFLGNIYLMLRECTGRVPDKYFILKFDKILKIAFLW